jgi:hypothetical protein
MSVSATFADAAPRPGAETATLVLIVWAATVAASLLGAPSPSTDDAMRLVEVRDWLAGQSWFDLTQYRLMPPGGVPMHWSRLIDLPLAVLIRLGELALPPALAEWTATIVWPAALWLMLLGGVARLAQNLAGNAAAKLALIFAALTAPLLQHFRPGAIDHHNAQLVLLVWSLVFAARIAPHRRDGLIAGGLCGLSLAIGQEMAPAIVALAAVVALRWIVQGEAAKTSTAAFALALAGMTVAMFAVIVPPARYAVAACDALSIVQVLTAGIGGIGLASLTAMRGLSSGGRRFVAAAALAVLTIAIVALGFPDCLGDPYRHLDPRLTALWLSNVNEARSIFSLLRDLPQEVPLHYGLPAVALVFGVAHCLRAPADERWAWSVCLAVLAALAALAVWQVRGSASANAIAAAMVPALLVRRMPAPNNGALFLGLGRGALIVALMINPLALVPFGAAAARLAEVASGAQHPAVLSEGPGTCRRAADYAQLAHLPRGRVLGFIDAGPFILSETPHDALAAPYHRNVKGNAAMLDVFLARPGDAAARLAALGVDYVVFCPGAPERYNYAAAAPDGLAAALGNGETPAFLERILLDHTDLMLYRRGPEVIR